MNLTTLLPYFFVLPWTTVDRDLNNHFFDTANEFFATVVKDGLVDYQGVKDHPEMLNQLLEQIERFNYNDAGPDVQKAFLINAYNILTIKGIVDTYPVKGPMKINGFFTAENYVLAGKNVSLDIVEKKMLYGTYPDSRLHFVLVCAAISCPKLANHAYLPVNLDNQLDAKTREILNDPDFIRESKGKVLVSEIFRWYANDFKDAGSVIDYLNKYRETPYSSGTKHGFYTYDWTLNDQQGQ